MIVQMEKYEEKGYRHRNGNDVADTEYVEGLFVDGTEQYRAEESLGELFSSVDCITLCQQRLAMWNCILIPNNVPTIRSRYSIQRHPMHYPELGPLGGRFPPGTAMGQ